MFFGFFCISYIGVKKKILEQMLLYDKDVCNSSLAYRFIHTDNNWRDEIIKFKVVECLQIV